jgi:CheY-like chemotaxis protein
MPPVIAFMDDLMFLSRVREAARAQGLEVRGARTLLELQEACSTPPRVVLVDLDSPRLPTGEALASLRADPGLAGVPVVGFFSHVHGERARAAQAAGCTRVLARSAFVQKLPELLASPGTADPPPGSDA